jgi:hypothetical protein
VNTLKTFPWKIFFILLVACTFSLIALIPYAITAQGGTFSLNMLTPSMLLLISIQVSIQALIFAVAIFIGLLLAKHIGLGLPILDAKLAGESVSARVRAILLPSIVPSVLLSLIVIALEIFVFTPLLQTQTDLHPTLQSAQDGVWQGFLASFYGGITEETLIRLGCLSLLAWLGKFISHTPEGRPTPAVFWVANILAAILFGVSHLPFTSQIMDLNLLVVTRGVVLNAVLGILFGYLYWTRGLESAMLSHFTADIVLHVLPPICLVVYIIYFS